MLEQEREGHDLVLAGLVEWENIILVLVIRTARELHLLDGLIDGTRIPAFEHLLDTDGLLDGLWQDFLTDEEESTLLFIHTLRLQWILLF